MSSTVLLDSARRLPRGRHGIPPERVSAHQQARLHDATSALLAERGYAQLTVEDLTARACVSRATFYKLFDDKYDCLRSTHQEACRELFASLRPACASQGEWPGGVAAAIAAAIEFATERPDRAHLILASTHCSTEPLMEREGAALRRRLIRFLRGGARTFPAAGTPNSIGEQAAIGAATAVLSAHLGERDLMRLHLELTQILLTPYLGAEEASWIAQAAITAAPHTKVGRRSR